MRFYEGSHTFKYNWDQMTRAFWCRYPNPFSKHVLSEDIIQRYVDDTGKLCTKRLISKTNAAPKWAERFLPTKCLYVVEESIVDPINRTLVTYTRNIGLKHLMTIEEKVIYKQNKENPNWTVAERCAWINSSVYGLSRAVQAFGYERFKHNVTKACKGLQFVCDHMFTVESGGVKSIDSVILNPLLKEKLREKALKATELAAAAKSKAYPHVAAAYEIPINGSK